MASQPQTSRICIKRLCPSMAVTVDTRLALVGMPLAPEFLFTMFDFVRRGGANQRYVSSIVSLIYSCHPSFSLSKRVRSTAPNIWLWAWHSPFLSLTRGWQILSRPYSRLHILLYEVFSTLFSLLCTSNATLNAVSVRMGHHGLYISLLSRKLTAPYLMWPLWCSR